MREPGIGGTISRRVSGSYLSADRDHSPRHKRQRAETDARGVERCESSTTGGSRRSLLVIQSDTFNQRVRTTVP